ncbi:TPR/MLP1/MLP2-like protein-domain-containing protein [Collybia nuda]|uniref:TPR/MLP1/MLP2-like protein-domain-containing protein n=1 Tax=Collybia nuda TaxID=64659 RepID=A0A9P5YGP5_9AGAR|nr:TPR/MLP1/MLP2-like protein-domain-containing protein [Collybia nuda]
MSQDQLAMQAREIDDLSKRNQQLFDQWSRVDIECTHATEELQIATGRIEQLRNECANLRAEKKIWESVQNRLIEENKTVALERSHLSDLMVNVQKMHNDLERSGENDRRRLEGQLQMLENQTQDLRSQLSQERDNARHVALQKDIELKELQTRLDRAALEFSKTRESLVGAETSRKHLEERVEDLTRQLQGNEEKLSVYERRPNTNGSAHNVGEMSREQQLEAEVAELRSTIKVTEVDLATARSHVQQFKEISQANEEALASLHITYDEYKASTEAQLAHHESEYKALHEKLQAAQDELTQLISKHNDLQKQLESERHAWMNDKKTLEDTIVDMSTSEKHSESDRASRESEVRQQEERAKVAEEKYSSEVIAHAESIKAIEVLKRDLATTQKAARDGLTAAETAQIKLATSEGSWKQQKEALDKEITSLNARCQDLSSQNTILHQHLESVSSQANRIKVAVTSAATEGEVGGQGDEATQLSELGAVVTYLRKEKEIGELQLELSKQETARLKAQIDHLSQSLDETRTTLSEERERAVETAASAVQHAELLERINQLNILRESNATLRADCESHAKKARDLETKLQQVSQELDPAKEQARIAQAELEASKSQLQRQQEENRRWQERNSQLLTKYDRIDPAEVQSLRDEIELFKSQKVEIEQQKIEVEKAVTEKQSVISTQESRITTLEEALRNHKEHIARNTNHFKTKMGEFNSQRSKFTEEKRVLEAQIATLEQANNALRVDVDKFKSSTVPVPAESASDQTATIATLQAERDKLLMEKATWTSQVPTVVDAAPNSDEAKRLWDTERVELVKARDEAIAKVKAAIAETQKAVEEGKEFKRSSDKLQARMRDMMKAKAAEEDRQAAAADAAKALGEKDGGNSTAGQQAELAKKHADELHLVETKLAAKHQQELKTAVEAARKEATEAAQRVASEAGQDGKPGLNGDLDRESAINTAVAEVEEKLKAKHAEELVTAMERGKTEGMAKAKLKDQLLVRAQKKVKDLEAQIVEWRGAGLIPQAPALTVPVKPVTVTSAPTAGPSTVAALPVAPTTSSGTPATPNLIVNTALPQKPSITTPTGPAPAGLGRGRGGATSRGRAIQRAMAGGLGRAAPTKPIETPAGGMSIMGAAGKRPRESEVPDDSLAKRLKPAEVAVKPPVTLRRPAPGPPP